jgi:hypothetical protein
MGSSGSLIALLLVSHANSRAVGPLSALSEANVPAGVFVGRLWSVRCPGAGLIEIIEAHIGWKWKANDNLIVSVFVCAACCSG